VDGDRIEQNVRKGKLYSSLFQVSAAKWMKNALFEGIGIFEYGTDVLPKRR